MIYCAEIQIKDNVGNIDTLENIIKINQRNILQNIDTGYYIIAIGTYEECEKAIKKIKELKA